MWAGFGTTRRQSILRVSRGELVVALLLGRVLRRGWGLRALGYV